jgi:N-formylmethionyl-tRNA deformylase
MRRPEAGQGDRILVLGDARLRSICAPVEDPLAPAIVLECLRLEDALEAFREEQGFGRGIAAPQIGIRRRIVALDLGSGPRCLINPTISWRSEPTFTLWDDCMSLPGILVRVRRNCSINVEYLDEEGAMRVWEGLGRPESELLQHEIDHLDGVLALDRALEGESIIFRQAYDEDPERFRAMVDYEIQPTVQRAG